MALQHVFGVNVTEESTPFLRSLEKTPGFKSITFIFIPHHRNQPERFTPDDTCRWAGNSRAEGNPGNSGTSQGCCHDTKTKHVAKANPIPGKWSQLLTLLKDDPVQPSGDEPAECHAPKPTSALQELLCQTSGCPPQIPKSSVGGAAANPEVPSGRLGSCLRFIPLLLARAQHSSALGLHNWAGRVRPVGSVWSPCPAGHRDVAVRHGCTST